MSNYSIRPEFIAGPSGKLFCTIYSNEYHSTGKWIIHVPAFAEEMNKSRCMVSEQARAFAKDGHSVIVADLYGTGDSEADFCGANWEKWKLDIIFLTNWVVDQGATSATLWGLRLGCLLATQITVENKKYIDELLFWQPVHSGQQFVTQFLRLRLAAAMMNGSSESTSDLRARLIAGEGLEVAGYELSPALVRELDEADLAQLTPPVSIKVYCLELISRDEKPASLPTRKLVETWQKLGVDISFATVVGPAFWATQEIALAPALISKTTEMLIQPAKQTARASTHVPLIVEPFLRVDGAAVLEDERPCAFPCQGETLMGITHFSSKPEQVGVVLLVGGPQYRVGSHRQFTLLARALAADGIPVFRFDYRGMGDSSGSAVGFDGASEDIRHAIDQFQLMAPTVERVVIWGLCDAATAASFYAPGDFRVTALVLLNPWVHSEEGSAKAYLRHYYLRRLFDPELWKKIRTGNFSIRYSLNSIWTLIGSAFGGRGNAGSVATSGEGNSAPKELLINRMKKSMEKFDGKILMILSGDDLTAAEFKDSVKTIKGFPRLLTHQKFTIQHLEAADHTFSRKVWRDEVAKRTSEWVLSLHK